jgi:periplasmic protein TonB
MDMVIEPAMIERHMAGHLPSESAAPAYLVTWLPPDPFGVAPAMRRLLFAAVAVAHVLTLLFVLHLKTEGGSDHAPGVLQVSWLNDEHPAPPATPEPSVKPKPLPMRVKQAAAATQRVKPILAIKSDAPAPTDVVTIAPQTKDLSPSRPEDATALPKGPAAASATQAGAVPAPSAPSFEADYLSNPAPEYPALSRQLHEHGLVTLRIHVTADGKPDNVLLYQGSGYARLDQAAIDVVWRWRFVPARQGREDVAGWVIVPIRFILRS